MPELTIGDKTVTVGDEFLKLSPADQNAAVSHIAQQIGLTSAPAPAAAPDAAPVDDVRFQPGANSAAKVLEGVPVLGAYVPQVGAAVSAAANPLTGVGSKGETFGERYRKNLEQEKGVSAAIDKNQPVLSTVAKMTGGVLATAPLMAAAPAAFGLAGPMSTMVRNGAISGATLSAADAAARGEDVGASALTGGILGGAAGPAGKVVGKVVSSIADRIRPPAVVPQNVARVGNVDIPLSESQVTGNAAASAEEQILARGGRGEAAQEVGQGFRDRQDAAVNHARSEIGAGLDPTGAAASTAPQDAAERVASELIAQEQAKAVAEAGNVAQVGRDGTALARGMDPNGQLRAPTPFDAAETMSGDIARARDAAKADYRGKYNAVAAAPGEFAPGSAAGFRSEVEAGLRAGDHPVSLDPTNTPKALNALKIIDDNLNSVGPGAPRAPAAAVAADPEHARNLADIRAKFGDDVATAYDRQKAAAAAPPAPQSPPAPKAQSLLEFIASKGGLGPDAEINAIGGHGHTVNVEGVGRRKLVRQGGWPLDYAREAAQEAGYLHGDHNGGTSTVNDLLDAMDAEMRGQKRYPQGFEGHAGKREAVARSEREQHELEQHMQGFRDYLDAEGHGGLAPEVKERAATLLAREGGMDADQAVTHAIHQLEQEDAAGMARRVSDFPGDRPAPKAPAAETPGSGFTMRDVEQVRKQLSTLYGDARRAMMAGGSGADLHALEHITEQFDARVSRMVQDGKFGGDGAAVLKMQQDARASFADYKQKFAKRGAGDQVGAAVEKILGKFSDTKATPDAIVNLAYGSPSSPGGQMPVQIAQRIAKIFGRDSGEFATYKQGLFGHLMQGEDVAKTAARIDDFLNGTKGKMLAHTVFDPAERADLARHADKLRGIAPKANDPGAIGAAVRRITGADGAPPAPTNEVVNYLYGPAGKGAGRVSVPLAAHLKQSLSPEGWAAVRQGMWEKLTNAGEGKIPFEAQALSQRLHEFLNESGAQLSKVMFSDKELKLMQQLASVYKQMIPVKGTTNPSGTAPMLAKIASGTRKTLLPLLGFSSGGLPGAALALGVDKGLTAIGNAHSARSATRLFYGEQAKRAADPRFSKGLGIISQGSTLEFNRRRSR